MIILLLYTPISWGIMENIVVLCVVIMENNDILVFPCTDMMGKNVSFGCNLHFNEWGLLIFLVVLWPELMWTNTKFGCSMQWYGGTNDPFRCKLHLHYKNFVGSHVLGDPLMSQFTWCKQTLRLVQWPQDVTCRKIWQLTLPHLVTWCK